MQRLGSKLIHKARSLARMLLVRAFFEIIWALFWGWSACNLGSLSIFESEINGYIRTMEYTCQHGWWSLLFESDASTAMLIFKNLVTIPISHQNRWHNCLHLGLQVVSSNIYHKVNCYAIKLFNMFHSFQDMFGSMLCPLLVVIFFRDVMDSQLIATFRL